MNFFLLNETGAIGGGISHDEFIDNVASDILNKVPKLFEVWRIKKALQMNLTPTGVVLLQELDRFNLLLERLDKTLVLLRKVRFKFIFSPVCIICHTGSTIFVFFFHFGLIVVNGNFTYQRVLCRYKT